MARIKQPQAGRNTREGTALMNDMESNVLKIVSHGGDASSRALEALDLYAEGNTPGALAALEEAGEALLLAHKSQYALLSAKEGAPVSIVMAHAMDICAVAANNIQFAKKLIAIFEAKRGDGP